MTGSCRPRVSKIEGKLRLYSRRSLSPPTMRADLGQSLLSLGYGGELTRVGVLESICSRLTWSD